MAERLISIIVPLLDECESLPELYARIRSAISNTGERYELIFVDDGSRDGSANEILRLRERDPRIALIRHQTSHGKSMALMQAFELAQGDIAITLDADLQDEPEQIPLFLNKIDEGLDMVNGCRVDRHDTALRRGVSRIFNRLIRRLFQLDLQDINCGFKALRKPLYKRLDLRGDLHRLIPVLAAALGYTVGEVPVHHSERKHGQSKYKLLRHRGILDIISLTASLSTRMRPFHALAELALIPFFGMLMLGVGWIGLETGLLQAGAWQSVLGTLSLVGATWCLFVTTALVLVGFILDVLIAPHQNAGWRQNLVTQTVNAEPAPPEPTIFEALGIAELNEAEKSEERRSDVRPVRLSVD